MPWLVLPWHPALSLRSIPEALAALCRQPLYRWILKSTLGLCDELPVDGSGAYKMPSIGAKCQRVSWLTLVYRLCPGRALRYMLLMSTHESCILFWHCPPFRADLTTTLVARRVRWASAPFSIRAAANTARPVCVCADMIRTSSYELALACQSPPSLLPPASVKVPVSLLLALPPPPLPDVHLLVDGIGRCNVLASLPRPDIPHAFTRSLFHFSSLECVCVCLLSPSWADVSPHRVAQLWTDQDTS